MLVYILSLFLISQPNINSDTVDIINMTAADARAIMRQDNSKIFLKKIWAYACEGEDYLDISSRVDPVLYKQLNKATIIRLEKLGYTVTNYSGQETSAFYRIKW